ncbi:MAG TPA: ATP-binding protein [Gemmatimonadaceae bacterium]|nr:ATP-binding protein [Gemmatimonadaceae bacterium]
MAKVQRGTLNGTPVKRVFLSIVSDYDFATGICELLDNSIDVWWPHRKARPLTISVVLDHERQVCVVEDNAGGVTETDLVALVAPGQSTNSVIGESIGVFGVGSKRAAIALAEHITIKTRTGEPETWQIDLTKDWIEADDWDVPFYATDGLAEHSTRVELMALRTRLTEDVVADTVEHMRAVYAEFLQSGRLTIEVNGQRLTPTPFDQWAYPKGQPPQRMTREVTVPGTGTVRVAITAGLTYDRQPDSDNYGVYFYCNGRLIVAGLKSREVGYFSTNPGAGVPHPDASLARVIVSLRGPVRLMPWTSNKAGINFSHPIFQAVRETIIPLIEHFSSLSRRLKDTWETDVFPKRKGSIVETGLTSKDTPRAHLPSLPAVHRQSGASLVARNRKQIEAAPWTRGLVEAIAATDVIERQRFDTGNRIALILLDSTFEIAIKEFVVHRTDLFPVKQHETAQLRELFGTRREIVARVAKAADINKSLVDRAEHFYGLRNKLIHERATAEPTAADIRNYRNVVQQVLQILFGLNVGPA